jgi:hypothetical protein
LITHKKDSTARFIGNGHPCFNQKCKNHQESLQPIVCSNKEIQENIVKCTGGLTFFSASSKSYKFKNGYYNGFGKITIKGIRIENYWSAINIYSKNKAINRKVNISNNKFVNIGQSVNSEHWPHAYGAIVFKGVTGSLIGNNLFEKMLNTTPGTESHVHGIYLAHNSDNTTINQNYFFDIMGTPIKVRDGSDNTFIKRNVFRRSTHSDRLFPVQNWYAYWYRKDSNLPRSKIRELPSMNILMADNTYQGGYKKTPIATPGSDLQKRLCEQKLVATPNTLPKTYLSHQLDVKTAARFNIRGRKIYASHIAPLRCDVELQ